MENKNNLENSAIDWGLLRGITHATGGTILLLGKALGINAFEGIFGPTFGNIADYVFPAVLYLDAGCKFYEFYRNKKVRKQNE
jgi:hypothetical protein